MSIRILIILSIAFLFDGCNQYTKSSEEEQGSLVNLLEQSKNNTLNLSERIRLIDSALIRSQKLPLDSVHLAIISYKSTLHFKLKQKDSAFKYDNYLVRKANELTNEYYLAKGHLNIALSFNELEDFNKAFKHFNVSKGYYLKLQDSGKVGRQLVSMAMIQKNQGDFFGSKETIAEALQYLNPKKDARYISSSHNILGTNHRKLINYQDAIKYHSLAFTTANSEKDKLIYKNNLAATYIDSHKNEEAIFLLKSIKEDSLLHTKPKEQARVLDNLAYARWRSGKTIAANSFLEPLKIRQFNKDQRGQIASYTHLGEFYSKTNRLKAGSYFDSVIQVSKTIKMPQAEKDALKFLMALKPNSIELRDRYILLQDSLKNQDIKVKTQFAKYKYDDKLRQEDMLQLEKENAKSVLEASKQNSQKIMYLLGVVFLASVLGMVSYSFRQRTKVLKQKSKAEKLSAIFQTEAELARRLHDDHGGKLNQTMLLVDGDAAKAKILDNLEVLYNQSRDFSREINAVDTGPDFWNNLLAMMQLRTPSNVKLFIRGGKEVKWKLQSAIVKTVLFKIVQELMINLGKHSGANTVALTFQETGSGLKINYADDGNGASLEALRLKNGLLNTEKRIEAIGGSIIFESEKGNGFKAEIQFPL